MKSIRMSIRCPLDWHCRTRARTSRKIPVVGDEILPEAFGFGRFKISKSSICWKTTSRWFSMRSSISSCKVSRVLLKKSQRTLFSYSKKHLSTSIYLKKVVNLGLCSFHGNFTSVSLPIWEDRRPQFPQFSSTWKGKVDANIREM